MKPDESQLVMTFHSQLGGLSGVSVARLIVTASSDSWGRSKSQVGIF